ncbi:MAG: hemolysin [Flavobacteriales bacterium]|nr:hemolysin [Flavobacteriales bacterium]
MKNIIDPIPLHLIQKELTKERFIRKTNNANNEIYIVNYHNSPNVTQEIGRLREITFRNAGGGTGKECDLDNFDTQKEAYYEQLIVWAPESKEIVGGYRFIKCINALNENTPLATNGLFTFSENFKSQYLPSTIELGRSFVQPNFQPSQGSRKGIFSLDNLWDGLGAIVVDQPEINYFFGKVTMYLNFNKKARDLILAFMYHFFDDREKLVSPIKPLSFHSDVTNFISQINELEYKEAFKILQQNVRSFDENIPPLVSAYMNLSSTMKTFGTSLNNSFGEVEETGILISIDDIFDSKKERHINSYINPE